jgi:nitrate reductase NapD
MPEPKSDVAHISSAVVRCRPADMMRLAAEIDAMDGAETVHGEQGKLIVILEGPTSGAIGELLTRINLMEGVISAAMVYEQIEPVESLGEEA